MKCLALLTVLIPIALSCCGQEEKIDIKPDDPVVVFAMSELEKFMAQKRDDDRPRKLISVIDATRQTVAGELFRLDLLVNAKGLTVQRQICKVAVWQRVWLSGDEAMKLGEDPTCKDADR